MMFQLNGRHNGTYNRTDYYYKQKNQEKKALKNYK